MWTLIKGWGSSALGFATGGSWQLYAIGAVFLAIAAGWGYYAITTANLRTDVAVAQKSTSDVRVNLGSALDANHQLGSAFKLQNQAIGQFANRCEESSATATIAALQAMALSDAGKKSDEADPASGAARMNLFLKQNFGG